MARRFQFSEDGHGKFWEIEVSGTSVAVRFGKLGTPGQRKAKEHATHHAAQEAAAKLVREKIGKGYVEVADGETGPPAAADPLHREFDALRADGQEVLDACGELTLLAPGDDAEIAGSFVLGADGEAWAKILADVEWLAEEADGGAVGRWRGDPRPHVFYLDNEGSFRMTGTSLLDHCAFIRPDDETAALLAAFCRRHGLPAAVGSRAPRDVECPDERLEARKREAARQKRRAAPTAMGRGPRPFSRVLCVTGEDFGGSYGDIITRGATFLFDPATDSFTLHPPLGGTGPRLLLPLPGGRALLLSSSMLWEAGTWRPAGGAAIPVELRTRAYRLRDGSFVVFGAQDSRQAFRVVEGAVSAIGDLPTPRACDGMIELGDGRVWFGGGEALNEESFGPTRRTVILDPRSWTFAAGPDLPTDSPSRGGFSGGPDGAAVVLASGERYTWDGGRWSEGVALPALERVYEWTRLADGSLLGMREGTLVRVGASRWDVEDVGAARCAQGNATLVELGDGRVLFVGGAAFQNNEAEPEIWDPRTRTFSCLPGWDQEVARAERVIARYKERKARA
jgi:predicted DNA-binding WGR domain protein